MLDSSGYLEETDTDLVALHRARFFARWSAFGGIGPSRHRIFVARLHRRVVGALFSGRLRGSTTLIHQLGVCRSARRDRQIKRRICEGIYVSMIDTLHESRSEHVVGYMDARKQFNRVLYGEHAERLDDPSRCSVRVMAVSRLGTRLDHTADARQASPSEHHEIMSIAARRVSHAEARAMHFERASSEPRYVLLPRASQPTCALVMDPGEPGVNLFGLSSPCRVVPLAERVDAMHLQSVLATAGSTFHRLGLDEFVVFQDAERRVRGHAAELCGLADPIPGFCFVTARAALPAWRRHVVDMFRDRLGPLRYDGPVSV